MTTTLTGKELEQRLDHPLYGDGYLTGLAATALVFGFAGWGVGWGLLLGLVVGVGTVFVLAITAGLMTGDDPVGLRGRLYGAGIYAVLIGWVGIGAAGDAGFYVAAAVFVYLAARITRRHRALPRDLVVVPTPKPLPAEPPASAPTRPAADPPALPADAVAPPSAPPAIPGPVGVALSELPRDLQPDLRARVDAAVENYRQLHELLHDPQLLALSDIDAPGMIAAAEEVALDLLRQVPRIARIQALAARRGDDADARAASDAALAALRGQSEALYEAVSAAFRALAADQASDARELRDHTARLTALHRDHTPAG